MSKCPNYGKGRGGPNQVQTFCVHTCLMGGGGVGGGLDNVQSLVVFFFMAPLRDFDLRLKSLLRVS